MTSRPMRRATPSRLSSASNQAIRPSTFRPAFFTPHRSLAQVQSRHDVLPGTTFTRLGPSLSSQSPFTGSPPTSSSEQIPSSSSSSSSSPTPQPDPRTLKLGKTLRTLHDALPTLLATPLPPEILSPQITLHLFPSTHPHLPTVSGRVAYHAALWTAPVAWGRVPIVGNVRLEILSERMEQPSSYPPTTSSSSSSFSSPCDSTLLVRWKTCGKTRGKGMGALYRGIGASEQVDKITEWLGGDARDDEEFCGLFRFEFDREGRVVRHVIEHAERGGCYGGRRGESRVVGLTEWLLGRGLWRRRGRGKGEEGEAEEGLVWGFCEVGEERRVRVRGR